MATQSRSHGTQLTFDEAKGIVGDEAISNDPGLTTDNSGNPCGACRRFALCDSKRADMAHGRTAPPLSFRNLDGFGG
jgi:hypothetical protein